MAFALVLSLTHSVGDGLRDSVDDVPQLNVPGPRLELGLGVDAAFGKILMVEVVVDGWQIGRLLYLLSFRIQLDPDTFRSQNL